MATGDTPDILARLRGLLPPWFPNQGSAPVVDGTLTGIAALLSYVYSLIQYARAQARISTASGGWLDLIAWDFFGSRFLRRPAELDISFQPRLLKELLRPRLTRAAISQMVDDLTGFVPSIIEPWNGQDLGGLDLGNLALDAAGGIGSNQGNQIYVTAFRPITYGLAIAAGLDAGPGGLDSGLLELLDPQQLPSVVADAEITARIQQTVAAGVNATIGVIAPPAAVAWDVPGVDWDTPGVVWP